jgi:hypothetical protein
VAADAFGALIDIKVHAVAAKTIRQMIVALGRRRQRAITVALSKIRGLTDKEVLGGHGDIGCRRGEFVVRYFDAGQWVW